MTPDDQRVSLFLEAIVAVGRACGFSISYDDTYESFRVEPMDEENYERMLEAHDHTRDDECE